MIDVVPEPVEPNTPVAELVVRLHDVPGGEAPEQVYLFPLGQPADKSIVPLKGAGTPWASKPQRMRTLDGHVLLRWKHDRACWFARSRRAAMGHTPRGPTGPTRTPAHRMARR